MRRGAGHSAKPVPEPCSGLPRRAEAAGARAAPTPAPLLRTEGCPEISRSPANVDRSPRTCIQAGPIRVSGYTRVVTTCV